MFKKTILLALSILSSSSFASGYMGIGLGPEIAVFKNDGHVSQTNQGTLEFNVKDNNEFSGTGWFGTLFAGYGINFHKDFYIAGEANFNLSSVQHKSSNDELVHMSFSNTSYRLQHNFGFSVLPGFQFDDTTLFYLPLGYEVAKFKISTTDISLKSISENLDGFRCGVGIKKQISSRYAVRLEYSHVSYKRTSVSTLDVLSNTSKSTTISPRTNRVELGLVYDFC